MVDVKGALFEKVASPLLVALLLPGFVVLGSKLATGEWLMWLRGVSPLVWGLVVALFTLWTVLAILRMRAVHQRRRGSSGSRAALFYKRVEYCRIEHAGVLWRVMVPSSTLLYPPQQPGVDLDRVEVKTPPLCPKCETELEQAERYFGGYVWTCVRCKHKTKATDSYYRESGRAERIAKSVIQEKLRQAQ